MASAVIAIVTHFLQPQWSRLSQASPWLCDGRSTQQQHFPTLLYIYDHVVSFAIEIILDRSIRQTWTKLPADNDHNQPAALNYTNNNCNPRPEMITIAIVSVIIQIIIPETAVNCYRSLQTVLACPRSRQLQQRRSWCAALTIDRPTKLVIARKIPRNDRGSIYYYLCGSSPFNSAKLQHLRDLAFSRLKVHSL